MLAGGGTVTTIGTGFSTPQGLLVDPYGNVVVADAGNNAIKQIIPSGGFYIYPSLPAGLTLNTSTAMASGVNCPLASITGVRL